MKRVCVLFIGAMIMLGGSPAFVSAEQDSIKINEVMYNPPGADLGKEWIELYNPGEEDILVKHYSVEVAGTVWKRAFVIEDELTIRPGYFLTLCEQSVPGCDYYTDKIAMQNGGGATDGVRIKDSDGIVLDTFLYDIPNSNELREDSGVVAQDSNTIHNCNEGRSLGRKVDGVDTNISIHDLTCLARPSMGFSNSMVEYTGRAKITEILPYQQLGYIELVGNIDPVDGWYFMDGVGNRKDAAISDLINENAQLTILKYEYAHKSEGCLYLYAPDDTVIDSACFVNPIPIVGVCRDDKDNTVLKYCKISPGLYPNELYMEPPDILNSHNVDSDQAVLVTVRAEIIYQIDEYLYLETDIEEDKSKVIFRIDKVESLIDVSEMTGAEFEIQGFWIRYSQGNTYGKYQIYPTSIKAEQSEVVALANSGAPIIVFMIFCLFVLFLLKYICSRL